MYEISMATICWDLRSYNAEVVLQFTFLRFHPCYAHTQSSLWFSYWSVGQEALSDIHVYAVEHHTESK